MLHYLYKKTTKESDVEHGESVPLVKGSNDIQLHRIKPEVIPFVKCYIRHHGRLLGVTRWLL